VRGSGTGSWSSRPWRSRSVLRGESTTTYASSKLNRVGRRAARYDSGLSAHKCTRPAHKRPAPHRIAHEQIACSRSRCGNFTPSTRFFPLPPVNPCQHPGSLPLAPPLPSPQHNHARYDNDSRLTQVADPTGTYQFTFDNMGRLTNTTTSYAFLTGRNFTTSYAYDAASNRTGFTDPESGATSYVYDTLNRLQTLTPPAAFSGTGNFGFSYDALSRRTQMTRPNGLKSVYAYDNLSRLLSVLHQSGSTTLDGASYAVDNAGNRTSKTDQLAGVTSNYTYDPIYELTQVTQATTTTESYTYDSVGNRLSSLGVSPYSVNTSNELTSTPSTTYTYDYNGNTQTKVVGSNTTSYAWDFENRMSSVTLPGSGGTVTFRYDPFGRRIYKSSSAGISIFAYDGDNLIEETNSAGTAVARYEPTQNIDEPLAMLRSGATSYYHADGLGSVTSLSNAAGSIANTYTYDSFGKLTASTGSLVNPFQYTARESDTETGLYYYRARYYDASSGKFLSEDPLEGAGDGPNFYTYVLNNPANFVDPFGLNSGTATWPGILIRPIVGVAPWVRPFAGAIGLFLGLTVGADATGIDDARAIPKTKNPTPDCKKKGCKPCEPPVGTVGYRFDSGTSQARRHYPALCCHYQLTIVNQDPETCVCYWNRLGKHSVPIVPFGAVPRLDDSPLAGGGGPL